jgi:Tfp pilus assembly protein PilE
MPATLRRRPNGSAEGFTVPLLAVLIALGILLTIGGWTYVGIHDRESNSAARANLRAIGPSIEQYFLDRGPYVGMTLSFLRDHYDRTLDVSGSGSPYSIPTSALTRSGYCVQATSGGKTWRRSGPSAPLEKKACPA